MRASSGDAQVVADDDAALDLEAGLDAPAQTFARMPADTTTMSQSSGVPSSNVRPVIAWSSPSTAVVLFARWVFTPIAVQRAAEHRRRAGVELHLHQVGIRCTTWTSSSSLSRPRAASRPSSPPPITAARFVPAA